MNTGANAECYYEINELQRRPAFVCRNDYLGDIYTSFQEVYLPCVASLKFEGGNSVP